MTRWLVWFPLRLLRWALVIVGAMAILVAATIATPLVHPPELTSISQTARNVDRSNMPQPERFPARDGTQLAYRHYPARGQATGRAAILVHGSSGSSAAAHALADALASHGVETFAPDVRGHGGSGTRGDIAYLGQLEDDMADFVAVVRKSAPGQPITLIGHSAGGGFALRLASSPIKDLFARTVLLAPYLGYDAPTNRPHSGGWANADLPRFFALAAMHRLGIACCDGLATLAFAVPPNSATLLVPTYSYRLMRNFATRGYRSDLAVVTKPLTLFAGAADELMLPDRYADAVHEVLPSADVKLLDGIDHMGVVSTPSAVNAVAKDVATRGVAGS